MTIAVIWQELGNQWCVADTRLVGGNDRPTTEIAAKIYAIPIVVAALDSDLDPLEPHYRTQYGLVYAGAALPASMTAITASTFLQKLGRSGPRADPPTFEQIAELVHRLAKRFMADRRQFGSEGIFSAAFFGWCPHAEKYKIAHIDGRNDAGSFRVELSYPPPPQTDGDPWLVLGSGAPMFASALVAYRSTERAMLPRRVVDKMVADGQEPTVGGATSIGMARKYGFDLYCALELTRLVFNGLDLKTEVGKVGEYYVTVFATPPPDAFEPWPDERRRALTAPVRGAERKAAGTEDSQ
jgi:hypothetical protein